MNIDMDRFREWGRWLDPRDFQYLGLAPAPVRALVVAIAAVFVLGAASYFVIQPTLQAHIKAQTEERELRAEFESIQAKVSNIDALDQQLASMRGRFDTMLRQLPPRTDMEQLVDDLARVAVAAGLDIRFFRPGAENKHDFYASYPIELRVVGTYNEFGRFVSGLAGIPRIVTIHDVRIGSVDTDSDDAGGEQLKMTLQARTYRYLSKEERRAQAAKDDGEDDQ